MNGKRAGRWIAVAVALASIGAGACSSGNGGNSGAGQNTGLTLPGGALDPAAFMILHAKQNAAHVKVTYAAKGEGYSFTLVSSRDGSRRSFESDSGSGARLIVTPTATIECRNLRVRPRCTDEAGYGSKLREQGISPLIWTVEDSLDRAVRTESIDRVQESRIAGRATRCVTIDGALVTSRLGDGSKAASGTACIDRNTGVLLSWQAGPGTAAQDASITATKVEAPSPSDFVPPAVIEPAAGAPAAG